MNKLINIISQIVIIFIFSVLISCSTPQIIESETDLNKTSSNSKVTQSVSTTTNYDDTTGNVTSETTTTTTIDESGSEIIEYKTETISEEKTWVDKILESGFFQAMIFIGGIFLLLALIAGCIKFRVWRVVSAIVKFWRWLWKKW